MNKTNDVGWPDRSRAAWLRWRLDRTACASLIALRALAARLGRPGRWLARLLDRIDERRALALRAHLGRGRYLVSWSPAPGGLWLARLSGPGLAVTIERTGPLRTRAIARSTRALERILAHRAAASSASPRRGEGPNVEEQ